MDRRFFLKNAGPVSVLSSLAILSSIRYLNSGSAILAPQRKGYEDRVLVLVLLDGGNDGLNTVIPLDQYVNLTRARKNLLIPDDKVLLIDNAIPTGLHPALRDLQTMYHEKRLSIVQGVGYPDPDLSHFRSIDIWNSASDSSSIINTGWLGRYLDREYKSASMGKTNFDPAAVEIGSSLSGILQGPVNNVGMAISDTDSFYDIVADRYYTGDPTLTRGQLPFFRETVSRSGIDFHKVQAASRAQQNLSKRYPPAGTNLLADKLKVTAQLIGGGLQTKVYVVSLGGFDTHGAQVDPSNTTKGQHADLLSKLSVALAAFEDDIHLMGVQDRVLGMTYSEFGRRIKSNASNGSDHGTSAPVLLFGSKLKGGMIGRNPEIPRQADVNDNLPMQYDFRSLYTSILKDWFGLPESDITAILFQKFPALPLFKA